MKTVKKTFSVFLCLVMVLSAVHAACAVASAEGASLPSFEGNYTTATEFSELTPSETAYVDANTGGACGLDTESELFTKGFMVDSAANIGAGSGKTNFHGFYARDIDSDGGSDYMEAFSYDNGGMFFTLGLHTPAANGKAIAIRMESNFQGSFDSWSQGFSFVLNTANQSYAMLSAADAAASTNYYYISGGTLNEYNYKTEGWLHMPFRYADGWLVLPLELFAGGNAIDTSALTSIKFTSTSYWGIYFRIYEIGIVSNYKDFLGIPTPVEETGYVTMATDWSTLTPSDTAYRDLPAGDCVLNMESELLADGYMLDDSSVIGTGSGKTNFHGFYAVDLDSDGGTDYLEAYPYDAGGMRFTLAMTEEPEVTGEAIAIHMAQNFASNLSEWSLGFGFTLNTTKGSYNLLDASNATTSATYYYLTNAGALTTYQYKTEGWAHMPPSFAEGWLILPLSMFENGKNIDTADIRSIKFWLSSYWNANTRIYGVGYVTDMYALLGLERPAPAISESPYLKQINNPSVLPVTSTDYIDGYQAENPNWECALSTNTTLFSSGVMLANETFGIGTDKSNFHGVYTRDGDGDGKTDLLEFFPYNNEGMRFTLGMNGASFAGANAIAIHFANNGNGGWTTDTWINTDLTLNLTGGESLTLKKGLDNGFCAYYYADGDRSVTVRNMDADSCNGYIVRACTSGWLVLPAYAFGSFDMSAVESISFNMASTWSYNMSIGEICAVTDMNAFLGRELGDIDGDGEIGASDMINLRKYLMGISTTVYQNDVLRCDVSGDLKIDILDLVNLKKKSSVA